MFILSSSVTSWEQQIGVEKRGSNSGQSRHDSWNFRQRQAERDFKRGSAEDERKAVQPGSSVYTNRILVNSSFQYVPVTVVDTINRCRWRKKPTVLPQQGERKSRRWYRED